MGWLRRQDRNGDDREEWDLPLTEQDPGSPEQMSIWTILAAAVMWGLVALFVVGGQWRLFGNHSP